MTKSEISAKGTTRVNALLALNVSMSIDACTASSMGIV